MPSRSTIDQTNIRALQPIYFAAALEQLRFFDVVERIVQSFQSGLLPISSGRAARRLRQYVREQPERLTATQRLALYIRMLGIGGSDVEARPNREFPRLWLRFLVAVAELQSKEDGRSAVRRRSVLSDARVLACARALALNLSRRRQTNLTRYAIAIQHDIERAIGLLSDPEIRQAYGARDMWQVIEQLANAELGARPSIARFRILANAGNTILAWLAKRAAQLAGDTRASAAGQPSDRDLLAAVAAWLAAASGDDEDE